MLGPKFFTCKFLVIPSQFAGDVATLNAMGVAMHNIYGTDINKHAVAEASRRYPSAHFVTRPFWEATEAFPSLREGIGCAFIDLCSPLREEVIERIFSMSKHVQLLGFEFMCGREMGKRNAALGIGSTAEVAAATCLRYLQNLSHSRKYFNISKSWSYASHSASHFGKPMILGLGKFSREKRVNLNTTKVEATWETVRSACIANPANAPLWNVSTGTLAAWRAHETRGTYHRE